MNVAKIALRLMGAREAGGRAVENGTIPQPLGTFPSAFPDVGFMRAVGDGDRPRVVHGAQVVGAHHLEVEETSGATGQEKTGAKQRITFRHCIIAAGSVVTKEMPERTIAAGNPAKIIKTR